MSLRFDWVLSGTLAVGVLWSAHALVRDLSPRVARHWRALQAAPWPARWALWVLLGLLAIRIARFGWRPLAVGALLVGGWWLWGATASRSGRA